MHFLQQPLPRVDAVGASSTLAPTPYHTPFPNSLLPWDLSLRLQQCVGAFSPLASQPTESLPQWQLTLGLIAGEPMTWDRDGCQELEQ